MPTDPKKHPPLTERQPSLQKQGMGQQHSPRREASENYSATDQRNDKARIDLAANNAPRSMAVPDDATGQDAQVEDARKNRRS